MSSNRLQRASHRTASAQLQTSYRKNHDSLNFTSIELLWAAKCNVITDTSSYSSCGSLDAGRLTFYGFDRVTYVRAGIAGIGPGQAKQASDAGSEAVSNVEGRERS